MDLIFSAMASARRMWPLAVMCTAFWLINRRKIAPLPVMLSCGAANLIAHLLFL